MKPFLDLHSTLHCQKKISVAGARAQSDRWVVAGLLHIVQAGLESHRGCCHSFLLSYFACDKPRKQDWIHKFSSSVNPTCSAAKKRGGRHGQWLCYLFIFFCSHFRMFFFCFFDGRGRILGQWKPRKPRAPRLVHGFHSRSRFSPFASRNNVTK